MYPLPRSRKGSSAKRATLLLMHSTMKAQIHMYLEGSGIRIDISEHEGHPVEAD
jgi:hypothetical protein